MYYSKWCSDHWQEGIRREIKLEEDEPALVELMLRFLYTGSYESTLVGLTPAEVDAHLYALADKYDISRLKKAAQTEFDKAIADSTLLVCFVPKLLELVYTTTPPSDRGLRDSVTKLLIHHRTELRALDDFVDLVKNKLGGDFALDVIDAFSGTRTPPNSSEEPLNPSRPYCYRCGTKSRTGGASVAAVRKRATRKDMCSVQLADLV